MWLCVVNDLSMEDFSHETLSERRWRDWVSKTRSLPKHLPHSGFPLSVPLIAVVQLFFLSRIVN